MFVRYVSHEIRTPLNTVVMGLKLLHKRLAVLKEQQLIEIVQDLSTSTDVAVDILNDLLTYEKLSSNILELDKKVLKVEDFVNNTCHPFFLQVIDLLISSARV